MIEYYYKYTMPKFLLTNSKSCRGGSMGDFRK